MSEHGSKLIHVTLDSCSGFFIGQVQEWLRITKRAELGASPGPEQNVFGAERAVTPAGCVQLFDCCAAPLQGAEEFLARHVEWPQKSAGAVVEQQQKSLIVLFFKFEHVYEA
jgi:hypothetical protein